MWKAEFQLDYFEIAIPAGMVRSRGDLIFPRIRIVTLNPQKKLSKKDIKASCKELANGLEGLTQYRDVKVKLLRQWEEDIP